MPRMPKSTTSTPRRQLALRPAAAASARRSRRRRGTRCRCRRRGRACRRARRPPPASGSTSSGEKKKRCPGWRALAEVAARVVLERHRELHAALDVLLRSPRRRRPGRRARGRRRRRPSRGRSRTRLPRPHLDAVDRHASGPGRSSSSAAAIDAHRAHQPELADRAVQAHQLLRRERLGALEDLARARVGVAHLGLLLVGQAEDVEHQHLVDLAAVEQVARALGRDARDSPRG